RKRQIAEKSMRNQKMSRQSVHRSEIQPGRTQRRDANTKDHGSLSSRGAQVVRAPAQSFWCVAMQDEARDQPDQEHHPGIRMSELQPPNVPGNESGKCKRFNQCENSKGLLAQHTRLSPA